MCFYHLGDWCPLETVGTALAYVTKYCTFLSKPRLVLEFLCYILSKKIDYAAFLETLCTHYTTQSWIYSSAPLSSPLILLCELFFQAIHWLLVLFKCSSLSIFSDHKHYFGSCYPFLLLKLSIWCRFLNLYTIPYFSLEYFWCVCMCVYHSGIRYSIYSVLNLLFSLNV